MINLCNKFRIFSEFRSKNVCSLDNLLVKAYAGTVIL